MDAKDSRPPCRVCGKPVGTIRDDFGDPPDVHLLCNHMAFHHDADPDQPCQRIDCPWFIFQAYKDKLLSLGLNADDVVEEAIQRRIAQRKGSA